MQVTKEYKLELSDYVDLWEYTQTLSAINQLKILPPIIIVEIILCIYAKNLELVIFTICIILLILGVLALFPFIRKWGRKNIAKRLKKKFDVAHVLDIIFNIQISMNGILEEVSLSITNEHEAHNISFDKVTSVLESPKGIYIIAGEISITIPKRLFSDHEIDKIKEILHENIPKKKLKLQKNN